MAAAEILADASKATDSNNNPYSGAKWFFYQSGGLTLQSVYTTSALTTAHTNPVIADSSGRFPTIYFDATKQYRGILKNSDESETLEDIDPINAGAMSVFSETGGAALVGTADGETVQKTIDRISFETVALLLADTGTTTSTGRIWRTGSYSYKEAASGASDHDTTTAGGIKLYLEKSAQGTVSPSQLNAVGDGTTNDAAIIDVLNTSGRVVDLEGKTFAYTGSFSPLADFRNGLIVDSNRTWSFEPNMQRFSDPDIIHYFGRGEGQFVGTYTVDFNSTFADGASSAKSVTCNGLSTATRVSVVPRSSSWTGGVGFQGCDPAAANSLQVRASNYSGANATPGNREVLAFEGENQTLRQVFALSDTIEDLDSFFAYVDSQTNSCIGYKTRNGGVSWTPNYCFNGAKAIRASLRVSSANGNTHIAAGGDPNPKMFRTTDGGDSWTDLGTFTSAVIFFSLAQEGGEASGNANVIAGDGRGHVWLNDASGASGSWTDLGEVATGYDQVWGLLYLSGSGTSAKYLALLNDSSDTLAPAVYEITNLNRTGPTMTATSKGTVDVAGNAFQAYLLTSDDTLIFGNEGGKVYRSVSPYTTFTEVMDVTDFDSTETKFRAVVQLTDKTMVGFGQDDGYRYVSENDGQTWFREGQRTGGLSSIICARPYLSDQGVLVGCGQGLNTDEPYKAGFYRMMTNYRSY